MSKINALNSGLRETSDCFGDENFLWAGLQAYADSSWDHVLLSDEPEWLLWPFISAENLLFVRVMLQLPHNILLSAFGTKLFLLIHVLFDGLSAGNRWIVTKIYYFAWFRFLDNVPLTELIEFAVVNLNHF